MHHCPSGPPPSARISGALTRWSLLLRATLRHTVPARPGRLVFGALVTTTVVGLVLAIPVISGVGGDSPAVELDSSSTAAAARDGIPPIVMGIDGRPVSAADFAGVTTSGTPTPTPESTTVASAPAAPAAPEEPPAGETGEVPAPGTTDAAPAATPSTGGTPSPPAGSSSAAPRTRQPTTPQPAPAPAPPPAAPVEAPAEVSEAAAEVLALVNSERAALGCGALVADSGLTADAQAHSASMSASGDLGDEGLGEAAVVAHGRSNAPSVVSSWLSDADDSSVLLDCSHTSTGIAVVDGWWTAILA